MTYQKYAAELKQMLLRDNITRFMLCDNDGGFIEYERVRTAKDISDTIHGKHIEFACSECGATIGCVEGGTLDGAEFNYCPGCGAKLEDT